MAHTAYPTTTDLAAFLSAAGVDASALDLGSAIDDGITAFEEQTGRVPMLAGGSVVNRAAAVADSTRSFDPPTNGAVLDLDSGLTALTSLGINGNIQTINADFWLSPYNAPNLGKPYGQIVFQQMRWPQFWTVQWQKSIVIVGRWGYAAAIPGDAWTAMLELAAMGLYEQIMQVRSGGLERLSIGQGDLNIQWGFRPSALMQQWQAHTDKTIARYLAVAF